MGIFSRYSVCILLYNLLISSSLISGEMNNLTVEELNKLFDAAVRKAEFPLSITYVVETMVPPPTQQQREAELRSANDLDAKSLDHLEPGIRKKVLESLRSENETKFIQNEGKESHNLFKATAVLSENLYKREETAYRTSKSYDPNTIESLPIIGNSVNGLALNVVTGTRFTYNIAHLLKTVSIDNYRDEPRMDWVWRAFGMEFEEFGGPIILGLGKRNSKEKWNRTRDGIENAEFDLNKAIVFAEGNNKFETIRGESIVWNGIQCRRIVILAKIPESAAKTLDTSVAKKVLDLPITFEYILNRTNFSLFYYGRYDNPHEMVKYVSIREDFDSNGMPKIWRTSIVRPDNPLEKTSATHIIDYKFGIKSDLSEVFKFEIPSGYSVDEMTSNGVGKPISNSLFTFTQKRLFAIIVFTAITVVALVQLVRVGISGRSKKPH